MLKRLFTLLMMAVSSISHAMHTDAGPSEGGGSKNPVVSSARISPDQGSGNKFSPLPPAYDGDAERALKTSSGVSKDQGFDELGDLPIRELALVRMTTFLPYDGSQRLIPKETETYTGYVPELLRTTLHFTLNGKVVAHEDGSWDHMKSAIILPFDEYQSRIVGGVIADLYIYGPLKISPRAIFVLAKGEKTEGLNGKIEVFDPISESMDQAVQRVLKKNGYMTLTLQEKFGVVYINGVCESPTLGKKNVSFESPKFWNLFSRTFHRGLHTSSPQGLFGASEFTQMFFPYLAMARVYRDAEGNEEKLSEAQAEHAEIFSHHILDIELFLNLQRAFYDHESIPVETRELVRSREPHLKYLNRIFHAEKKRIEKEERTSFLLPDLEKIIHAGSLATIEDVLAQLRSKAVPFACKINIPSKSEIHCVNGFQFKVYRLESEGFLGVTPVDDFIHYLSATDSFPERILGILNDYLKSQGRDPIDNKHTLRDNHLRGV